MQCPKCRIQLCGALFVCEASRSVQIFMSKHVREELALGNLAVLVLVSYTEDVVPVVL